VNFRISQKTRKTCRDVVLVSSLVFPLSFVCPVHFLKLHFKRIKSNIYLDTWSSCVDQKTEIMEFLIGSLILLLLNFLFSTGSSQYFLLLLNLDRIFYSINWHRIWWKLIEHLDRTFESSRAKI
jgi:hypothetical protein